MYIWKAGSLQDRAVIPNKTTQEFLIFMERKKKTNKKTTVLGALQNVCVCQGKM